jgi:hypothetical protein
MENNKLKIVFAGLYRDSNLGDIVIAKCAEDIFLRDLDKSKYQVDYVTINHYCFEQIPKWTLRLMKLSSCFNLKLDKLIEYKIRNDYVRFFKSRLKNADIVVVVGGGLIEFTGGRFADGLYAIAKSGSKNHFKVYLNAVGVEGYDEQNPRCRELKKALQQESIASVTVRDDINTLIGKYFDGKPKVPCACVADTAVWAAEVYGIQRDYLSKTIGIGIIRKDIFIQYGGQITPEDLAVLYVNICLHYISEGISVELFTNGCEADNNFAFEIQTILSTMNRYVAVIIPKTDYELIETISRYKAVIAGRLHSCIISYSLNIPAVGLVWNSKLSLFGEMIGSPSNFIVPNSSADIDRIVNQLSFAMAQGYNQLHRTEFRQSIIKSIDNAVNQFR